MKKEEKDWDKEKRCGI